MNEAESSVCARLRTLRIHLKHTQDKFAVELGISRPKLISIEYQHTPLRYDLGRLICETFDVSQFWLGEGIGHPHPCHQIADDVEAAIAPGMLFFEAYQQFLRPHLDEGKIAILKSAFGQGVKIGFRPIGLPADKQREWDILQEMRAALSAMPHERLAELWKALDEAIDQFCAKHGIERRRVGLFRPKDWPKTKPVPFDHSVFSGAGRPAPIQTVGQLPTSKLKVDTAKGAARVGPVSAEIPTWKQLVTELKRLTRRPGAKAQLAAELGTTRQNVNKWLSGVGAPSTDLTLDVLRWVLKHQE